MPVIFIMTDGMRPDGMQQADTPHLDRFIQTSAYTLTARSVIPSVTLPCHMSIFTGVPPQKHGIFDNEYLPTPHTASGLVEHLLAHEKRTAFYYNWDFLRDLCRPGHLDYSFYTNTAYDLNGDEPIVAHAIDALHARRDDFSFIYLGTIDVAGHAYGWMSDAYLRQIETIDSLIGQILAAIPDDYHILIHSDHGGHDNTHGTDSAEDMTVPWMLAGPNIKTGHHLTRTISLLDTAPTVAALLNVPLHPAWEGTPVTEAFINTMQPGVQGG